MSRPTIATPQATLVPVERRTEFLPRLFGRRLMLVCECAVFDFMTWLSPQDYGGGHWDFYELDGAPLFLAPASEKRFRIACGTNGYEGVMSAEAAGITATLFAFSHLSFQNDAEELTEGYARLHGYAAGHQDACEIFQAID